MALAAWLAWPYYLLRSASALLDELYAQHRPFAYRWNGVPFAVMKGRNSGCNGISKEETNKASQWIAEAEERIGQSAWSLQLEGREYLLLCRPGESISRYRLALLLQPNNPSLNLELGIAYTLDALMDPDLKLEGALDYEAALEAMLASGQASPSSEFLFDSALLLQEAQLPNQAREQWTQAADAERSSQWYPEDSERHDALVATLERRKQRIAMFSSSPKVFLAHAEGADEGVELALNTAVENWLPEMRDSADSRLALLKLGDLLRHLHHDLWLIDALKAAPSSEVQEAFENLSRAVRLNVRGEYEAAEQIADKAKELFVRAHNRAGELRAQLEAVYSADRQWQNPGDCINTSSSLRKGAMSRSYVWIAAQAWLEEISCRTKTRQQDVIALRQEAYNWIANHTGYEGLRLRALGFTTEEYVSAASRLTLWQRGEQGLKSFWSEPLPALRGYALYYSLADSASQAGRHNAAVALLRESALLLKEEGTTVLEALLLSYLGCQELKAGLPRDADADFRAMDDEYGKINPGEIEKPRVESEIIRAAALISQRRSAEGLQLLEQQTRELKWPYNTLLRNARRPLLPALGDAYLAASRFDDACKNYRESIEENLQELKDVNDRTQRANALHEIEPAWRGMTDVAIRQGHFSEALRVWEEFRSSRGPESVPALTSHPDCSGTASAAFPVDPNESILVYAILPDGLSGWIVNSAGVVEQRWIEDGAGTQALALRFSELAATHASSLKEISQVSQEMYRRLMEPFAQKLPRSGVVVVDADGVLAGIPWAALEDRSGTPLIERFAFCQTLGIAEALEPRRDFHPDTSKALIFGSPKLEGDLARQYPDLPNAVSQAIRVNHRFPGSLLLKRENATANAFRQHAPQASLVHFAGHGVSFGGFGALLLARSPGGDIYSQYMTANDIAKLDLRPVELVVLAACSSGVGEQSGIVNLDSLSRALLEAGARRVIAANWDVDVPATDELMTAFYGHLADNRPAEALRQAARSVRQKKPHPYYWAGFRVFGRP